jgi:PST family polysaccharide transporter
MRSFANQFVRAVHWSIAISIATLLVQLAVTAIVARILTPRDFGLYAIANIAFVLAMHVSDRGLVSAIVREPSLDSDVVGSALRLSCGVSIALACIVFFLAPWVGGTGGNTQDDETIGVLIQLISVRILVAGIGTCAQALMQRELRFRDLGAIQFAGLLFGTGGITLALAYLGQGPRSLFWGDVTNSAIVSGACWWCVRERWSTSWNASHAVRIAWSGSRMTTLRVLDVLWMQLPLLVAKAYLGPSAVGLYQRSQTLVDIGIQYTSGRFNSVLYPAIAARQNRTAFLRDLIPPVVGLYALFLFSAAAFVAVMAPDIVQLLLGPAWADAAPIIPWIMIGFVTLHVSQSASTQLEARGHLTPRIIGSASGAAGVVLLSVWFVKSYGLGGIAAAAVLSAVATTLINFTAIAHYLGVRLVSLARWVIPSVCVSLALFIILEAFYSYVVDRIPSAMLRLIVMGIIAIVVALTGFRLSLTANRREALSVYIPEDVPRFVDVIAKLLGLWRPKPHSVEERVMG